MARFLLQALRVPLSLGVRSEDPRVPSEVVAVGSGPALLAPVALLLWLSVSLESCLGKSRGRCLLLEIAAAEPLEIERRPISEGKMCFAFMEESPK